MKIALISPKGPLYRHRGGIFRRSLRYAPLTLTTLASLVPADLDAEVTLIDEGIDDVDLDLKADVIGMTVITGTAPRAYELADHFRARGIPVVLGGPHVTLVPDDAEPHADSVVVGYAEDTWPELLRDLAAGRLQPRYTQEPELTLAGRPFPRRDLLPARRFLTTNVFEATRGCIHNCDFCVVPAAWGRKPYSEAGRRGRRGHPAARRAQADLRRSQPDRRPGLCGGAVRGADSAPRRVVRAVDGAPRRRSAAARVSRRAAAAAGCCWASSRSSGATCASRARSSTTRRTIRDVVELLHAQRHRRVRLFRVRHGPRHARRVSRDRALRGRGRHRSAAVRDRDAVSGHRAPPAAGAGRAHPHAQLGAVRRPARRLSARADERDRSCRTGPSAPGGYAYSVPSIARRMRSSPASLWVALAPISATGITLTICIASTTATGSSKPACGRRRRSA